MEDFFMKLFFYSVSLSIVIIFFILLTPFLSKRYTSKGLYYTWLIVVVGLTMPLFPTIDLKVLPIDLQTEIILSKPIISLQRLSENKIIQNLEKVNPVPSQLSIPWLKMIVMLWLVGVILFLTYHGVRHYKMIKLINRWGEDVSNKKIMEQMEGIKESLRIKKDLPLKVYPSIASPMILGVIKPQIVLPSIDYSSTQIELILKHELVHLKRKDLWYKYLILVATALHWFNPLVYLMAKAIIIQGELSCDAAVVSGLSLTRKQEYCRMIIQVANKPFKTKTMLLINFYGGKKDMKNRILSIIDTSKKKFGVTLMCGALLVTLGIAIPNTVSASGSTQVSNKNAENNASSITLQDYRVDQENLETSAEIVMSRPELEFYIDSKDVEKVEITTENEYLYVVDWREHIDSDTESSYRQQINIAFDEEIDDSKEIWYRWRPVKLYDWASEDDYSRYLASNITFDDSMTPKEKLALAAGETNSDRTGIGHIQLDEYPEALTKDRVTVKITDKQGNIITKFIHIKISNNEFNETVVKAYVEK